jgi:hypothetical protein
MTQTSTPSSKTFSTVRIDRSASAWDKATEQDLIQQIADALPQDSYLKSLLTPAALEWIKTKIHDDIAPDLYSWLIHTEAELNTANDLAGKDKASLTYRCGKLEEQLAEAQQFLKNRDAAQLAYKEQTDRTIEQLRTGLTEERKISRGYYEALTTEQVSHSGDKQTILELKAQLFDLLTGQVTVRDEQQAELFRAREAQRNLSE